MTAFFVAKSNSTALGDLATFGFRMGTARPAPFNFIIFLADIVYLQPIGHRLVIYAQSVRHADRQFGRPSHRCEDFLEFDVGGLEYLDNTLGNSVGVESPVEFWVLRGNASWTLSGVAEVAAVEFVAEAIGSSLHDIFPNRDTRCAKQYKCGGICCQISFFTDTSGGDERQLVLLSLLDQIEITVPQVRCDRVTHLVHRNVIGRAGPTVLAVDAQGSGIGVSRKVVQDCACRLGAGNLRIYRDPESPGHGHGLD